MVVIVDANILLSSIIKIKSSLTTLLINNSSRIDFVVPEFIITEIKGKEKKICASIKINVTNFNQSFQFLLSHVLLLSDDHIGEATFKKAYEITKSVDVNDTIYVAFAIELDALLWTGDLKLYRELRRKGFNNVVTTRELKEIIKGL